MKVIRSMPPDGWVPVANTTAQGRALSWRAKGLLLELLSYPDGYDLTFDRLMARAKAAGDPDVEGRDAMRRAMQELERKGYLAHRRVAVPDAPPGRQRWRTETAISDQPIFLNPGGTDSQYPQDSVPPEVSSPKDQELSNKTSSTKTDWEKDQAGKSSSALAGARAGQQASQQDRRRARLEALWTAASELDDDRLRGLLLRFERKRPLIYREQRQAAIGQFQREDPEALQSTRQVDLLSYKYALMHYSEDGKLLPDWLTRLPG